ncbi:phosphomevalonate kinase [Streptomyces sp. NBC_00435]|uniref:phosphomevalonate kinase n=1 Tax=Streptomyces sp. NBC_00435 TaxID=2903649 RepID=UPI002E221383
MSRTVVCRAPGKLFVAGEYAVLSPGEPAVIVAVDRYITVTATSARQADAELVTHLTGGPYLLHRDSDGHLPGRVHTPHPPALRHLLAALSVVDEFRAASRVPPLPVHLAVSSTLHELGVKIGLGSSGAVTVAAVHALDTFYGLGLSAEMRLRLALLATAQEDPHASGADVAASTWGGWIRYTAPDRGRLRHMSATLGVAAALHADWPGLSVRHVAPPATTLHVGWTGTPASSPDKVGRLQDTAWWNSEAHQCFLNRSRRVVDALVQALRPGENRIPLSTIETARRLLSTLDQQTSAGIFTPALTTLCDAARLLGGAGKPSGAGGGDCGIALLPDGADPDALHEAWTDAAISPLALRTAPPSVMTGPTTGPIGPSPRTVATAATGPGTRRTP